MKVLDFHGYPLFKQTRRPKGQISTYVAHILGTQEFELSRYTRRRDFLNIICDVIRRAGLSEVVFICFEEKRSHESRYRCDWGMTAWMRVDVQNNP